MELAHIGSYAYRDDVPGDEVLREVLLHCGQVTGQELKIVAARCYRFRHRDYSLAVDDDRYRRAHPTAQYEAIVDISEALCLEADVVYTHRGQGFFCAIPMPRAIAIVQRGLTVGRYDRYLTHRTATRTAERLRLMLA